MRLCLWVGAAIWLALLVVGFFAPGNWTWGLPGPIGHMMNFMIVLWAVCLVMAPLIAARDPLDRTPAIQLYLLGTLGILLATFRLDEFAWLSQGSLYVTVAVTAGLAIWAHPRRRRLWTL